MLSSTFIDELGYVPFSKAGAELLFEVISRAYEHQSLMLTTNLAFEEWTEIFGSERLTGALLDRFTHRCHILEAMRTSWPDMSTPVLRGTRPRRIRLLMLRLLFETSCRPILTQSSRGFGSIETAREAAWSSLLTGGRIDILTTDGQGRFVVFELTLASICNKVLGQLLYYMSWVDKHLGKGPCRGIIVAKEISDDLILAAERVKGVSLYRYKLSFSVERVSGPYAQLGINPPFHLALGT